ncbi:MAG: B12-binding domain-containing radical SAM protein, partial [Halobacteriota archaeon]
TLLDIEPLRWQRRFIGISVTSETQLLPAYTLAALLRRRYGRLIHICFGGNFISRFIRLVKGPTALLALVDSYVLDEGEKALVALLNAVNDDLDFTQIKGIAVIRKDILHITPPTTLDVNELPTPDFHGLPLDKYFSPRLVLPIYSSRGCFAKCTFCSIPAASGGGFRVRSAHRIVTDIKTLIEAHGTEYFTFVDETLRPTVMQDVCEGIASQNLRVRWYGETRFGHQFTESFAQTLYDSGCRKLQFGLESYNQRILNLMRKGVRQRDIEPSLRALFSKGIAAHLFFMVGFPTETEEEARRTNEFTNRMVRLSKDEYGNPFTTRGFDVFSLDPLAPAYSEPEHHKIQLILENDSRKVVQRIEYRSEEGLQPEEAQRLVDEFRYGASALTSAGGAVRSPPGEITLEEPEELNFLASCWHADSRESISEENSMLRLIPPYFGGLSNDHLVFEHIDLLSPVPPKQFPVTTHTIFCPSTKAWMVIDSRLYERARSHEYVPPDVGAKLQALGFGKCQKYSVSDIILAQVFPLAFLDACSIHEADEGRSVTIVVHSNGQIVKVSALVFLALRLADGTRSLSDIGSSIAEIASISDPLFFAALQDKFFGLSRVMLLGFLDLPLSKSCCQKERGF